MLSEELKKIILAGIGAAAITTEKSKEVIGELVKKGELTVEQGKVMNEELKHKVSEKVKEHVTVSTVHVTAPCDVESVKSAVAKMTPEELQAVKAKIAETEAAAKEKKPAASTGEKPENAGA